MTGLRWFLVGVVALFAQAAAVSADERILFDIRLGAFKAGALEIADTVEGGGYALAGRLESTGFIAVIRKVRYDAATRGTVRRGRFTPALYTETTDTGQRVSAAEMAYLGGVPQVKVYRPARDPTPRDVDPATQGGALDPLTALFLTLRDRPAGAACDLSLRTYDGRRAARVDLEQASSAPDQITCSGAYRRVAGYTEEEMRDRAVFPLTMTLRPTGADGLWRVEKVELETIYGRGRLVRR